jgi:hypothetical protein
MARIMPTHAAAAQSLLRLGAVPTKESELRKARFVLQIHNSYARPVYPEMPSEITLEENELIDAYQDASRGTKLGRDKVRQLHYFGEWRRAIMKAEGRAGVNLGVLIDAARIFEAQGFAEEADALWDFAEAQNPGLMRSEVPEFRWWPWLVAWCSRHVRDLLLFPSYMRAMRHPKGGVPFHKPRGERESEDVEQQGQRDLWE